MANSSRQALRSCLHDAGMHALLPGIGAQLAQLQSVCSLRTPITPYVRRDAGAVCSSSYDSSTAAASPLDLRRRHAHVEQPWAGMLPRPAHLCCGGLAADRSSLSGTRAAAAPWAHMRAHLSGMATNYKSSSQEELVAELEAQGVLANSRVAAAFLELDRREFLNTHMGIPNHVAYMDGQMPIGQGQCISAPSLHAVCIELLEPALQAGGRALDVGSGSGYVCAVMSLLVGQGGDVVALERQERLLDHSRYAMAKVLGRMYSRYSPAAGQGPPNMDRIFNVQLVHANVLEDGVAGGLGLFDAVHVGAAAQEVHPALLALLKPGGRLVMPIGKPTQTQVLTVVDKAADGVLSYSTAGEVKLQPLTPPYADKPWW